VNCWSSTWDLRILQLTEVRLVDAQTVHCPWHVESLPHCRSCSLEKQANSSHKNEMVKQGERQTTSVKIFLIQTSQVQHFRWDDKKIGYPIDLTRSIPHLLLCKSAVLLMELFSAQMHVLLAEVFRALALWPTVLVLNWVYRTSEKMPKNFLHTHVHKELYLKPTRRSIFVYSSRACPGYIKIICDCAPMQSKLEANWDFTP